MTLDQPDRRINTEVLNCEWADRKEYVTRGDYDRRIPGNVAGQAGDSSVVDPDLVDEVGPIPDQSGLGAAASIPAVNAKVSGTGCARCIQTDCTRPILDAVETALFCEQACRT